MSFNKSPLAFDDIVQVFDKALNAPRGVKIPCQNRGAAVILRSRFNYYRSLNRKQSREVYTPGHPMYGRSAYDKLVLRIPPRGHPEESTLFIEPRSAEAFQVEEIA